MVVPKFDSTDRVNILMVFVPYLIEHSPVSISELSQTFDLTEKQVQEVIQLLAMSGVPGETASYQHEDLFDINWDAYDQGVIELWNHVGVRATPRFSAREAAALVAGLNFLAGALGPEFSMHIDSLLTKISQGASALPQNILLESVMPPSALGMFRSAIESQNTLEFDYVNSSLNESRRTVSPLRLDVVGRDWYLRAWCHDKQSLRTFKCDRMQKVKFSSAPFHSSAVNLVIPAELFIPQATDLTLHVRVSDLMLEMLSGYKPIIVGASQDEIEVEIIFASFENAYKFVLKYPGLVEIVGPDELRKEIVRRVTATADSFSALSL